VAIAAAVREHEPDAVRLAGPELGAVALAAAASLESGLPFLIVRKQAKDYGTSNRLEGIFEEGECVCLVEDVITSGGAAIEAVEALRAVCLRALKCSLRGRSRGGRRRRARSPCGEAPAALQRLRTPKNTRKSAWLSDIRLRC